MAYDVLIKNGTLVDGTGLFIYLSLARWVLALA